MPECSSMSYYKHSELGTCRETAKFGSMINVLVRLDFNQGNDDYFLTTVTIIKLSDFVCLFVCSGAN